MSDHVDIEKSCMCNVSIILTLRQTAHYVFALKSHKFPLMFHGISLSRNLAKIRQHLLVFLLLLLCTEITKVFFNICGKYMLCLLCRNRFKVTLRFIIFYKKNTRAKRVQKDKVAPIRDIRPMLNKNLERAYKPHECITLDQRSATCGSGAACGSFSPLLWLP